MAHVSYSDTTKARQRRFSPGIDGDLEWLALLRPIDDDFMRCIFRGQPELAQEVLCILTGIDDLEVVKLETQMDLKRVVGARSVELDVWCVDGEGRWYDMEVQRGDDPDARRARYYSASMDIEALQAGQSFGELPEQWVVFVTEDDPFSSGEGTYLFERKDGKGCMLRDGTHVLYANGSYRGDDELGHLMEDFGQADPSLMHSKGLRERVEYFKRSPEGVHEMCEIFEELRREGIEQGIEKGIEQGERNKSLSDLRTLMEKLHYTAQQALDFFEVPEADRPMYLTLLNAD